MYMLLEAFLADRVVQQELQQCRGAQLSNRRCLQSQARMLRYVPHEIAIIGVYAVRIPKRRRSQSFKLTEWLHTPLSACIDALERSENRVVVQASAPMYPGV